ncbi:Plus3 domain-containing protein [Abeliophyllum distichum]|uniref:Plus3 domain-containing protein n=1 Tax=Abeliophyllum distichum TaxID=126358 RepID=A0ABD1SB75_9LAMI
MHPFFREILKNWNLAPCQITPNGWGEMVASYLLWVVVEAGGNLTPREFESIYRPCRSSDWYNVSPRPGQKWGTATDNLNKVHNWKERFFFVGGDWDFMPEDPLLHVSISRRVGELDCGKLPISKRNQGELRSKWGKVRALSSHFRSLNNFLKDDNLLASCGLMAFRFKGVPILHLTHPVSGEGSSAQASQPEASGPSQEVQDATPSSTIPHPRPEADADANVHQRLPSSSHLHIDSTTSKDKGKKVVEGTEEAPSQKRKTLTATEGLMRDARKVRRTEEGRQSLPSLDGELEGTRNSPSSAGQNRRFCISERCKELSTLVMEMLPAHPSIVEVSVHRYWTPSWEKVAKETTVLERLQLAEVNLVRGLVLTKDIFSAFASFDAEEAKSKKLAKDLKAMGLEKAQLESEKRALQFKLDLVVTKESDMKAKHEIELKAAKECLKQAQDQRRATEASQKRVEETQKLVEDRTLEAEIALAAANSSLEVTAADNERSLAATKLELEKVRAERVDAEAKTVEAYQDAFVDTLEYQDLA